jgi:hypothetical protein
VPRKKQMRKKYEQMRRKTKCLLRRIKELV